MRRLIIDTDTAGDDATALLMALKFRDAKVEGVTVTCGNIDFDQQVENALYTVEVAGRSGEIRVYPGARHPLLRDWKTAEDVHGEDGMGNSHFPKAKQRAESRSAVDFMVDLVLRNPGKITIVAQGPLTNVALAVKKDPSFARKVKRLYFMGGTNQFRGNVTPAAEFNIWVDPDAAKVVFHSGIRATMVGWEICMKYALVGAADLDKIAQWDTQEARFFTSVNGVARDFTRRVEGIDCAPCPDTITVACALDDGVATDVRKRFVDVETGGEISRGATFVDDRGVSGMPPNIDVVYAASERRFKGMLFRMLRGKPF